MLDVAVLGFHIRTAPIEMRERLAQPYRGTAALHQNIPGISSIVLQTCNRFELYGAHAHHPLSRHEFIQHLAQQYQIDENILTEHSYWHTHTHACRHLMRVACGLDSITLGEAQILGQIRASMEPKPKSTQPLHRLFLFAIQAGRQARLHTAIGRHSTSIAHTAIALLKQHAAPQSPHIMVIGAGTIGAIAVATLRKAGIPVSICNRTPQRAYLLAERFGAVVVPWESRHHELTRHTGVIVATAASTYVLCPEYLPVPTAPLTAPCAIIDVAMPRNVHPHLGTMRGIDLYSIDDLQHVIDEHHAQRQQAIPAVEHIIEQHIAYWQIWQAQQQAKPHIMRLRQWGSHIYTTELTRALRKLAHHPHDATSILQEFGHRLTQKLLHPSTIELRSAAPHPRQDPPYNAFDISD